jgi:thiosulfate sulfurtransferase
MSFKHLSIVEAAQIIKETDTIIVDIRDTHAFEQGHIKHAKLINDTNIEVFIAETDKNKPLICYCYHGISSQNAASFFIQQGFNDVYSIDGGYEAWRKYHDQT